MPGRRIDIELIPETLIRTPGFPAALADVAGDPSLLALADEAAGHADALSALAAEFADFWERLAEFAGASADRQRSQRAARRARALVSERKGLDDRQRELLRAAGMGDWEHRWTESAERWHTAVSNFTESHEKAVKSGSEAVIGAFDDDRLQHALHVSNPDFHEFATRLWTAEKGSLDKKSARRLTGTLHRYLRRLSTRCETVSFFGPVRFARFDRLRAVPVEIGAPQAERVHVEASTWLVSALSRYLVDSTPIDRRRVRRSPLFTLTAQGLVHVPTGRRFRMSPAGRAIWNSADGRTVGEVVAAVERPIDEVVEELTRLGKAVELTVIDLPSTELRALTRLARADASIAELAAARDRFAARAWPLRRQEFAGARQIAAAFSSRERQRPGGHYADREIFHEDRTCRYSERVTLGAPVVDSVGAALTSVLPLCYLGGLLRRADARAALRAHLGGKAAPLAALTAVDLSPQGPLERALRDRLAAIVRTTPADADGTVRLSSDELHAGLADLWDAVPDDDPCLPSPDLMALDGELSSWLLAELHDDCSSIYGGLENPLHSEPEALWSRFSALVRDLVGDRCAAVVGRRRSAHVTPELPGLTVELSGRSGKPAEDVVPIGEVVVPPSADGVVIRGEHRLLYPGDLASPLHRALALPALVPVPIDLGDHTPRVSIDGTVYQRARWKIRCGGLDPLSVHRVRRDARLPQHVFLRHPSEPKPLYVNFADPLTVLEVSRLPQDSALVTEMLPAHGQLWWQVDGAQCAELRLGCLVRPHSEGEGSTS
ncbi:hypothetical protein GCM10011609_06540 [Lentzea pudingi]|uniref:Lantibiotic dehydratase N-terminal domain-containing protein n=1 Tax=Lentzea pudingi TaxID=1789439 RepID=A0ABQ2HAQ5_9PSEU|nr:lantibiotic dehydratase [Lentzea pudingi]GGM73435.1 hypothetical protein GCM10011609_06540 [Lentzea pudingi]